MSETAIKMAHPKSVTTVREIDTPAAIIQRKKKQSSVLCDRPRSFEIQVYYHPY